MQNHIRQLLKDSYLDQKLDTDEKHALHALLLSLKTHEKRYLRNQAFELVQQELSDGGDMGNALRWLQKVTKVIDKSDDLQVISSRAYFSPGKACRNAIIDLLDGARKRVDICVFTISDDYISDAIRRAFGRKVEVRIITDNDKANDRGSDIYQLLDEGMPVCMDTSSNHMHHKFALIDSQLINGSFNWTRSATEYNQENIVISDNRDVIGQFERTFNQLWRTYRQG